MLQSVLAGITETQTDVTNLQADVTNLQTDLNKVKVEEVIQTGTITVVPGDFTTLPSFRIKCNMPWDLMAVYVSTDGVDSDEYLTYGSYSFGQRIVQDLPPITVADGYDLIHFPIFASYMTENGQSVIAIPPDVWAAINTGQFGAPQGGFDVTFKIVIQRPQDPSFSYTIQLGKSLIPIFFFLIKF